MSEIEKLKSNLVSKQNPNFRMLNDNEAKRRVSESLSKDGRIQEDN